MMLACACSGREHPAACDFLCRMWRSCWVGLVDSLDQELIGTMVAQQLQAKPAASQASCKPSQLQVGGLRCTDRHCACRMCGEFRCAFLHRGC